MIFFFFLKKTKNVCLFYFVPLFLLECFFNRIKQKVCFFASFSCWVTKFAFLSIFVFSTHSFCFCLSLTRSILRNDHSFQSSSKFIVPPSLRNSMTHHATIEVNGLRMNIVGNPLHFLPYQKTKNTESSQPQTFTIVIMSIFGGKIIDVLQLVGRFLNRCVFCCSCNFSFRCGWGCLRSLQRQR